MPSEMYEIVALWLHECSIDYIFTAQTPIIVDESALLGFDRLSSFLCRCVLEVPGGHEYGGLRITYSERLYDKFSTYSTP